MTLALALALSCAALQAPDRAVLVRGGERTEIADPAVLRRLQSLLPAEGGSGDWTITLYAGDRALRDGKGSAADAPGLPGFLREQERLRQLFRELGSETQETRERAGRGLVAIGRAAVEPLRKLGERAADPEVRARAVQALKDIHAALRPKVQVRFLFARKDGRPNAPADLEDWIRKAAAGQGYANFDEQGSSAWAPIGEARRTIYPAVETGKPGGIYVSGWIAEWTLDGAATVEVTAPIKGWKSGRFALSAAEPRLLVRLSDQTIGDLFLAMRIAE